jgi:hypothetical protein
MTLVHCGTEDQITNVMTKSLKLDAFFKLCKLLGVCLESYVSQLLSSN